MTHKTIESAVLRFLYLTINFSDKICFYVVFLLFFKDFSLEENLFRIDYSGAQLCKTVNPTR